MVLLGHKHPRMLAGMVACLEAGRAYIPCDLAIPPARRARMMTLAGAETLVLCEEKLVPSALPAGLTCLDWPACCDALPAEGPAVPPAEEGADAYLLFTSGSTGVPKGVRVTRGNLNHFLTWFSEMDAIRSLRPRVVLNQALYSFDLSVADVYYSLASGAELAPLMQEEQQDFRALFARLAGCGAELAVLTPSFAELCLCDRSFSAALLPRLRVFFFCGELLKPRTAGRLFERFPGVRLLNAYGPTEATCAVCCAEITPEMTGWPRLPVGCADTAAVRMLVLEGERTLPEGAEGELVLCGGSVAAGYCGGLRGGFCTIDGAPAYRTGDLGYIRDGFVYCTGRLDSQIKYKGYRIEPGDIEAALCCIPGVARAAVIPVRGSDGLVASLTARIVGAPGLTAEQVRRAAAACLPAYMLPKTIELVERLPMNAHGKTDRLELERSSNDPIG